MESWEGRTKVTEDSEGLHLVLPTKKNWFVILFLAVWLCGWFFGESSVLGQLANAEARVFLMVWLVGWTAGGVAAAGAFVWQLFGREEIDVTSAALVVRMRVLAASFTRKYELSHVKNLRVADGSSSDGWSQQAQARALYSGRVVFDYGLKTRRIGIGLDDAEARHWIELIVRRL